MQGRHRSTRHLSQSSFSSFMKDDLSTIEEETNGPKDGKVTQQNAAADRGA